MSIFKDLLHPISTGWYKSAIEGPDNRQFEIDFGQMAYTFLQDRASKLLPYLIGFEVVEREEDGSRAVGIFGLKLGKDDFYYIPVFFINNQIKGMDLLYSKKTNLFFPLKESWINYILNRQNISFGEKSSPLAQEDFAQTNFHRVLLPPAQFSKLSSAVDVLNDARSMWNFFQKDIIYRMQKDATFQAAVANAICKLEKRALFVDPNNKELPVFLEKYGNFDIVKGLLSAITQDAKTASAVLEFYPKIEELFVVPVKSAEKRKNKKIDIIVSDNASELPGTLDEDKKVKLVQYGFTAIDPRNKKDKSEIFDISFIEKIAPPQFAGKYDVILKNGLLLPCWFLLVDHNFKYFLNSGANCILLGVDSPCCACVPSERVFVYDAQDKTLTESEQKNNLSKLYNDALRLDQIQVSKRYILISPDYSVSPVIHVYSILSEDGKNVVIHGRIDSDALSEKDNEFSTANLGSFDDPEKRRVLFYSSCSNSNINLTISDSKTVKKFLKLSPHDYVISSAIKAIPVPDWLDTVKFDGFSLHRFLGTPFDLYDVLYKNAIHRVSISTDDALEYNIRINDLNAAQMLSYKQAMVYLMSKLGLDEDDAIQLLHEAKQEKIANCLVKIGQLVGVSFPQDVSSQFMLPPQGYDPVLGATIESSYSTAVPGTLTNVPPKPNPLAPGINMGGEAETQAQLASEISLLAQQAAASGQQHVFDHGVIGSLARIYDVNAAIDAYIPKLISSLDALGRILFMFYWKNKEFSDRYGAEDLTVLEDSLRGVFKNFGDIILKLKQKSVETSVQNVT